MKKICCLLLCFALALPMFGCGMKQEDYIDPAPAQSLGQVTENTYVSSALNLALTLPADMSFASQSSYNLAKLRSGDPAGRQCEFFASGDPQDTSLQMMLTTEAAPDTQDLAEWLKAEGRVAADAEGATFTLLEQEYLLFTKAGNATTWQLYRIAEGKLILLQLQAMEQEYTLEQIAWLFYPAEETAPLSATPVLDAPTFSTVFATGKAWREYMYTDIAYWTFDPDGEAHLQQCSQYEVFGYGSGTYQAYGNIVRVMITVNATEMYGGPGVYYVLDAYYLVNPHGKTFTPLTKHAWNTPIGVPAKYY